MKHEPVLFDPAKRVGMMMGEFTPLRDRAVARERVMGASVDAIAEKMELAPGSVKRILAKDTVREAISDFADVRDQQAMDMLKDAKGELIKMMIDFATDPALPKQFRAKVAKDLVDMGTPKEMGDRSSEKTLTIEYMNGLKERAMLDAKS